MKFKTLLLITTCVIISSCANIKKQKASNENTISFRWEGFDFEGKHYNYGAMIVPVKINSINRKFDMQFDLGMNVNIIYEYPLKTIISKFPSLKNDLFIRKDYEIFYGNLLLDKIPSSIDSLFVYKGYGSKDSFEKLKKIGTIGVNEIDNKILKIDYPNQTLEILDDNSMFKSKGFVFSPIEITNNGKLKINLTIDGKEYPFLFDTGAGIVPATTIDYEFYKNITVSNTNGQDTISANSWGEKTVIIGNLIKKDINVGNQILNSQDKRFYYTDNQKQKAFFNDLDIYGSVGNEFFINDVIVLDLKNKLFGIKKR